jgi:hypothetical protein
MGSARLSETGQPCSADGGGAAWFVAELGSAGLVAGEARSCLARVGGAGFAARRSVADLGCARGPCRTARTSWRRRTCSHVGIASDPGGPVHNLGLAGPGLAGCSSSALMGRAAAVIGAAPGSSTRASTAGSATAGSRPVLGRTACASALLGRARTSRGGAGRARETRLSDGAFVEPAGTGLGPAQARRTGSTCAIFKRLGSAAVSGSRPAANRRAVVGGARRSSRAQVRFME